MIFFKSLPELKANSQACSGTKTQTFLQSCFESTKAAPVLKAAPGAEAKSWLSHLSHPQLLENSVTFCLWQLGRISAEGRLTGQAPSAAAALERAAQQAGRQGALLQEKCRCGTLKGWGDIMSFTVVTIGGL